MKTEKSAKRVKNRHTTKYVKNRDLRGVGLCYGINVRAFLVVELGGVTFFSMYFLSFQKFELFFMSIWT